MNVKLATQVLSSSVAEAIGFATENFKLAQFSNCQATTEFIRIFDEAFDLCNSTNPVAKGIKSGFTVENLARKIDFIYKAIDYIEGLSDSNGKQLVYSRRKTGFVGFICTLRSIMALTEQLFSTKYCKFILTYHLSQDHLETFFSRSRRKSGWNNNPTALQFKWTLRMLLLKNNVLPFKHANCIELECSNNLFSKESEEEENIYDPTLPPHFSQFVKLLQSPSVYHKHVLHYISGYMCKKLASLSKCHTCKEILSKRNVNEANSEDAVFMRKRDKGGLVYSQDMHKVLTATDQVLLRILSSGKGPVKSVDRHLERKVYQDVLQKVGRELLKEIWSHSIGCHPIESEDSHASQIIPGVVTIFCKMILQHHEKVINERFVK